VDDEQLLNIYQQRIDNILKHNYNNVLVVSKLLVLSYLIVLSISTPENLKVVEQQLLKLEGKWID
jgi:hypothetical protein